VRDARERRRTLVECAAKRDLHAIEGASAADEDGREARALRARVGRRRHRALGGERPRGDGQREQERDDCGM